MLVAAPLSTTAAWAILFTRMVILAAVVVLASSSSLVAKFASPVL